MTVHINPQVITQDGRPAFAVLPWDEYQALLGNQLDRDEVDVWFPNEVVKANVRGDCLIKAWREYFGLTQAELAARTGIKQSAIARLENNDTAPRTATLEKFARAMDIEIEQLID